jgi:DNA-binding MarR family transcriptional regulator
MRRSTASRDNLGYLLAKASQRWNELLRERFVHAGYPDVRPAYGSVLLPLFEEDGLRMGEIARRVRLSKQTMTTLVRLAERDGLVRREADPEDGRAFRIRLTARSLGFRSVVEDVLRELDELVARAVPPDDLRAVTRALRGVMEL